MVTNKYIYIFQTIVKTNFKSKNMYLYKWGYSTPLIYTFINIDIITQYYCAIVSIQSGRSKHTMQILNVKSKSKSISPWLQSKCKSKSISPC